MTRSFQSSSESLLKRRRPAGHRRHPAKPAVANRCTNLCNFPAEKRCASHVPIQRRSSLCATCPIASGWRPTCSRTDQSGCSQNAWLETTMARYLITGIAGFIGSSLAHELVRLGHDVRGVDNLSCGNLHNLDPILDDIDFRQMDINDTDCLRAFCHNVDYFSIRRRLPRCRARSRIRWAVTSPTSTAP
jgi:NAD dependent epimerase/dehydratase family